MNSKEAVDLLLSRADQARGNWTVGLAGTLLAAGLTGAAHDIECGCEDSTVAHLDRWLEGRERRQDVPRAPRAGWLTAERDALAAEVAKLRAGVAWIEAWCDDQQRLALPGMTPWDYAADVRAILVSHDLVTSPDAEGEA